MAAGTIGYGATVWSVVVACAALPHLPLGVEMPDAALTSDGPVQLRLRGPGPFDAAGHGVDVWFGASPIQSRTDAWDSLLQGLPDATVLPIPQHAAADRRLADWSEVWGVTGPSWRSLDISTNHAVWRVVVLDTEAFGDVAWDQLFWLPEVVAQGAYDHLVVFTKGPLTGDKATAAGRALFEVVQARAPADRLLLLSSGSSSVAGAYLPAGPWGELVLEVGKRDGGAEPVAVIRDPPLLDGFVRAAAAASGLDAAGLDTLPASAFAGEWEIRLFGHELDVYWRGVVPYHLRWSRTRGWLVES